MAKISCANCKTGIAFYSSRHKTKDKQYLCNDCFKLTDVPIADVKKYTVSQLFDSKSVSNTKSKVKHKRTKNKAESQAIKQGFKEITAGKPFIAVLIKQDSSNTFKSSDLSLTNDYVYQHEAGKVVINNKKEYLLKSATFTPLITGSKEFSVGKALTGAALIGELGLIAGASGKKGEDKSYCTLLLQEVETDEVVKITADCSVGQAKTLANFITAEEAGL